MKKLITIALIAIISVSSYAQERKEGQRRPEGNPMEKFTPEQRNELMLKKMTLELDLNASQQKEMSKIIAEQTAKREAHLKDRKAKTAKPTSDEIFEMKSKMLDEQIAMKGKMKKILSPEQFKKWDELKKHHREGMKKNHRPDMRKHERHGMKKDMKHKDSSAVKK
jgi:periplasmic protein CpxP/Spy